MGVRQWELLTQDRQTWKAIETKTIIKVYEGTKSIQINRGVKQGDTISRKPFSQALEDTYKRLEWEEKGITICGQRLNHLRYADDIVLITDKKEELFEMMKELDIEAGKIGLNMNYSKTKTITNTAEDITMRIGQDEIEQGISIDEKIFNHLRYADDIVLITDNLGEARVMLQQLQQVYRTPGYKTRIAYTRTDCHLEKCHTFQYYCHHCPDPNKDNFNIQAVRRICQPCYYL
ncbi:unnamed protein product [Diabrotica balteata]|uniref:Reverse transcriptase domain-containing protein n=1 Tax=Diabrotica balteata TaxID=107213 RepID=A0A9N9T3V1_DIABA|nr:unnamed protein product [Diabrotica balteata]